MDGRQFDRVARMLAAGHTRRSVLTMLLGVAAALVEGSPAMAADTAPHPLRAPRRCGGSRRVPCDDGKCCARTDLCIPGDGCMPLDGTTCGGGFCTAGHVCVDGFRCRTCVNRHDACGGDCPACPVGAACRADADCASGICAGRVCRECRAIADCPTDRPQCVDNACVECFDSANCPVERPVCDGGQCRICRHSGECDLGSFPICDAGVCRACHDDAECVVAVDPGATCHNGTCVGHCHDGRVSGDETDVDCGGRSCPTCAFGKQCARNRDCQSAFCNRGVCGCRDDVDCPPGFTCVGGSCALHCEDGVLSGDESDIDCGGSCDPCEAGQRCRADEDCATQFCDNGICTATCHDGILNGDESDVDCGGSCDQKCANGQTCRSGLDCQSTFCVASVCVDACNNGLRDGDETDVDCGGSCPDRCPDGARCNSGADCASGVCSGGTCEGSCLRDFPNCGERVTCLLRDPGSICESNCDCGGEFGLCFTPGVCSKIVCTDSVDDCLILLGQ